LVLTARANVLNVPPGLAFLRKRLLIVFFAARKSFWLGIEETITEFWNKAREFFQELYIYEHCFPPNANYALFSHAATEVRGYYPCPLSKDSVRYKVRIVG